MQNAFLQIDTWYCMSCAKEFLPFSDTSDEKLMQSTASKQIKLNHMDNIRKTLFRKFKN